MLTVSVAVLAGKVFAEGSGCCMSVGSTLLSLTTVALQHCLDQNVSNQ